jgi:hypothetical protein
VVFIIDIYGIYSFFSDSFRSFIWIVVPVSLWILFFFNKKTLLLNISDQDRSTASGWATLTQNCHWTDSLKLGFWLADIHLGSSWHFLNIQNASRVVDFKCVNLTIPPIRKCSTSRESSRTFWRHRLQRHPVVPLSKSLIEVQIKVVGTSVL